MMLGPTPSLSFLRRVETTRSFAGGHYKEDTFIIIIPVEQIWGKKKNFLHGSVRLHIRHQKMGLRPIFDIYIYTLSQVIVLIP